MIASNDRERHFRTEVIRTGRAREWVIFAILAFGNTRVPTRSPVSAGFRFAAVELRAGCTSIGTIIVNAALVVFIRELGDTIINHFL